MRYTAGILYAIGRIARCCCFPGDFAAFLDASPGELNKLMEECRLWDADHCQLGDHLAVAWKFPQKLGDANAHHHEVTSETPCMRRVVQASCIADSMSGFHTAGRRQEWEAARLEAVLAPGRGLRAPGRDLLEKIACKINRTECSLL